MKRRHTIPCKSRLPWTWSFQTSEDCGTEESRVLHHLLVLDRPGSVEEHRHETGRTVLDDEPEPEPDLRSSSPEETDDNERAKPELTLSGYGWD